MKPKGGQGGKGGTCDEWCYEVLVKCSWTHVERSSTSGNKVLRRRAGWISKAYNNADRAMDAVIGVGTFASAAGSTVAKAASRGVVAYLGWKALGVFAGLNRELYAAWDWDEDSTRTRMYYRDVGFKTAIRKVKCKKAGQSDEGVSCSVKNKRVQVKASGAGGEGRGSAPPGWGN